jgi:hypothetical protein
MQYSNRSGQKHTVLVADGIMERCPLLFSGSGNVMEDNLTFRINCLYSAVNLIVSFTTNKPTSMNMPLAHAILAVSHR